LPQAIVSASVPNEHRRAGAPKYSASYDPCASACCSRTVAASASRSPFVLPSIHPSRARRGARQLW
jgi:hypothetical protein